MPLTTVPESVEVTGAAGLLETETSATPATVDFVNPRTFGKLSDDPRTASPGGQPLMNLTLAVLV